MDNIIENRIQFGKAQYIPLIFLCLVDLNDGTQLVLSSFLTPIIQHQYMLTSAQASILTSFFYIGTFFGSIISGSLADKHGRKLLLAIGSISQFLTTSIFIFCTGFNSILFVRFLYGLSFGFTIVLTTSMFAQTSPMSYRGKGLLLINFNVSLGKIFGIILAYICLSNFHEGNWKLMMLLSSTPNLIVLYGIYYVMEQSPRFLLANQRYQESFIIIDKFIQSNHPNAQQSKLTFDEKQILKIWSQDTFSLKKPQFSSLFKEQYFTITIYLSLCWFCINCMYFGQLIILPFIYGKQEKSFFSYALTVAGQMPCFFLSLYLIDKPNFGRKNTLIYFFALSSVAHIIFSISPIAIIASLARFFMKQCFQMLYPFTTQSYGTLNRTLGFGFCAAIGRVGSSIIPYIIVPLVDIDINYIFIIFALFAVLGAFGAYKVPKQSLNKSLDEKKYTLLSQINKDQNIQRIK